MGNVYVLSSRCPLGCPYVVFVKRVTDGKPFAWCPGCGLAWLDPAKETLRPGDHGNAELHATSISAGSALEFANEDDVKRLGKIENYNLELGLDAAIRLNVRPNAPLIDGRDGIPLGHSKSMARQGDVGDVDLRMRHPLSEKRMSAASAYLTRSVRATKLTPP
jgi:hypothetical protein